MGEATFRFTYKKRLMTTYSKNESALEMKCRHKEVSNLLYDSCELLLNDCNYGYRKGKSVLDVLEKHRNSISFIKLDIKSFFNSIDRNILIEKVDCFVKKNDKNFYSAHQVNYNDILQTIEECKYISNINKGLSLGLIPSPVLSNIYLNDFDKRIEEIISYKGYCYTRYVDDIIISSVDYIQDSEKNYIIDIIKLLLSEIGLQINIRKTMKKDLCKFGDHIKILGINIVRYHGFNRITISRKYKRHTMEIKESNIKKGREKWQMNVEMLNHK